MAAPSTGRRLMAPSSPLRHSMHTRIDGYKEGSCSSACSHDGVSVGSTDSKLGRPAASGEQHAEAGMRWSHVFTSEGRGDCGSLVFVLGELGRDI